MQKIKVAFADGVKEIPLSPKTMETMTNFFELGTDGVFYFSAKKQKRFITKMLKK